MYELHHGDCIEVMRTLPAESVDAVITSPPYAIQRQESYGGIPADRYPDWTVAWMREARKVLKPAGSVIINITPSATGGQLADYVLQMRLALRGAGWLELDEMVWHKSTGLPNGNRNRPRRMWESLLWYSTRPDPFSDPLANGNDTPRRTQTASIHRQKAETGYSYLGGNGGTTPKVARVHNVFRHPADATVGVKHPARFPPALAEWCGKLICPPGGTILDPFSGSASTGVACIRNGWDYIGIDAVEEYVEMSRRRLEAEQHKLNAA